MFSQTPCCPSSAPPVGKQTFMTALQRISARERATGQEVEPRCQNLMCLPFHLSGGSCQRAVAVYPPCCRRQTGCQPCLMRWNRGWKTQRLIGSSQGSPWANFLTQDKNKNHFHSQCPMSNEQRSFTKKEVKIVLLALPKGCATILTPYTQNGLKTFLENSQP